MDLLKEDFKWRGHSSKWVIWSFNWMGLLKGAFKWMGHSSKWVIQVNWFAERGFQENGSFKQMGHSTECVIWSFNWMGLLKGASKWMGHSSEWVNQLNESFDWMGLLKGASKWMSHLSEWGIQMNGAFEWMGSEWGIQVHNSISVGVGGKLQMFCTLYGQLVYYLLHDAGRVSCYCK